MNQKKELRKIHLLSSNFIKISNPKQKLWCFQNFENTFFIEKINFSLFSAIKEEFLNRPEKRAQKNTPFKLKFHNKSSSQMKVMLFFEKLIGYDKFLQRFLR